MLVLGGLLGDRAKRLVFIFNLAFGYLALQLLRIQEPVLDLKSFFIEPTGRQSTYRFCHCSIVDLIFLLLQTRGQHVPLALHLRWQCRLDVLDATHPTHCLQMVHITLWRAPVLGLELLGDLCDFIEVVNTEQIPFRSLLFGVSLLWLLLLGEVRTAVGFEVGSSILLVAVPIV